MGTVPMDGLCLSQGLSHLSHTPGWTLRLPLGALLRGPRQNVQSDLRHLRIVWERVDKARSTGHRPELSGYTGFTTLSTGHFECFGMLCISFHTSPLHRATLIIDFPF